MSLLALACILVQLGNSLTTEKIELVNNPAVLAKARIALLAVKASAMSTAEPGALEYRLSQAGNVFNVWAKLVNLICTANEVEGECWFNLFIVKILGRSSRRSTYSNASLLGDAQRKRS